MTKQGDCQICHDPNQDNYYPGKKNICKKHHAEKANQRTSVAHIDETLEVIDTTVNGLKTGFEEITSFLQAQITKQNEEMSSLKDKIILLLEQNRQIFEKLTIYETHVKDVTTYQTKTEDIIYSQMEQVANEVDEIKETCCKSPKKVAKSPKKTAKSPKKTVKSPKKTAKSPKKAKKEDSPPVPLSEEAISQIPEYIKQLKAYHASPENFNKLTVKVIENVANYYNVKYNKSDNKEKLFGTVIETLKHLQKHYKQ